MASFTRFRRLLHVEALESRCLLAAEVWSRTVLASDNDRDVSSVVSNLVGKPTEDFAANPYHKFTFPNDVNNDGEVSAGDALTVINHLNAKRGLSPLPAGQIPEHFLDVTGDNHLSPADALTVINAINAGLTKPTLVSVDNDWRFEDAVSSRVAHPVPDECGGDPNDAEALVDFIGYYTGQLTVARAETQASYEEVRLDGGNNKEIWGIRKVATTHLTLQGFGSMSLTVVNAGAAGYSHEISCASNSQWIDQETQLALAQIDILAQGQFVIILTITAGFEVVGTDDYVLSSQVDRIGTTIVQFTQVDLAVDGDYIAFDGVVAGDSASVFQSSTQTIESFGTAGLLVEGQGREALIASVRTDLVSSQVFLPNTSDWQDENYRRAEVTLFSTPRDSLAGTLISNAAYAKAADSFSLDIATAPLNKPLVSLARDNSDPAAIAAHDAIFVERDKLVDLLFSV